jgi:lysophospholipase L1-like esterase
MILEKLLQKELGNESVDVINAGVISSTSFQGFSLLKANVERLKPDIVTVCYGFNDNEKVLESHPNLFKKITTKDALYEIRKILRKSNIYDLLRSQVIVLRDYFLSPLAQTKDSLTRAVPPEDFQSILYEFIHLGEEKGFNIILILEPTLQAVENGEKISELHEYYSIMRQVSEEKRILLVDSVDALKKSGQPDLLVDYCHLSKQGNRVVAEEISKTILHFLAQKAEGRNF